jgi:hypothetical protein
MRPLGVILRLILAFHVTAQRNNGDYSNSIRDKTLYYTTAAEVLERHHLKHLTDCQTSDTDTATVQPTVQPTDQLAVQPALQPTVQPTPQAPSVATQSCHGTDHYWWVSYSVLIRVPYSGAKDCDDTYHALESATASISNWQCVEEDGNIRLWFNAFPNYGSAINTALESRYPSVNSFNCPDD